MALQVETYISGRIGNIVYFKRGDRWMARALADKVKQTAATKNSSQLFGKASTAGKTLRMLLRPILPNPQDKAMQNSFSSTIARCMKGLQASGMQPLWPLQELGQFDFNKQTSIKERFRVAFTVSQPAVNLLQVYIPAFVPTQNIAAPAHTHRIDLHICAASCLLPDGQGQGAESHLLALPFDNQPVAEQFIQLVLPTTPGSLVLTGMRICYILDNEKLVTKDAFMPGSIVDGRFC